MNEKDLRWTLLSSKYIHKGKWATLRIDTCEMPNGTIVDDYYVLEYGTWVNGLAITEDDKVLMVKQYRHAADIISLEIPGGVVDDGEDPQQALRRELLEETGYQFDDFELLCIVTPNPSTGNNQVFSYLARGGKKVQEQALDDHEEIIVEEYSVEEIKELLAENKIMQAMHCTALFYGLMKLRKI
ncbi:MAG TPA: NUDIX hydrolase [Mucilaginibacter sp.]|nr:NUDIX hydrolase [Mucilaginibacter sp.]